MAGRVLVTGASGGIGEATVQRLLEEGWQVIATARDDLDLERLEALGCTALRCDLRAVDSIRDVAQRVAEGGGLDGVVLNAGLGLPGAIEDLGPGAWEHQFRVNVFGTVELARQLVPAVREAEGRFVFVSSQAALVSLPLYAAYVGSKKSLEAAADAMRMELREDGVRVSIVEPGPVTTPFHDRAESLRADYIDEAESRWAERYEDMDRTLSEQVTGKIPPEAVADTIHKALTARWPKARYRVGKLSWLGSVIVRLLPTWLRDRIVARTIGL